MVSFILCSGKWVKKFHFSKRWSSEPLIFEGDSWNEVCKTAGSETMTSGGLAARHWYGGKQLQDWSHLLFKAWPSWAQYWNGLHKNTIWHINESVGCHIWTKLSWEKHIVHVSIIVKKKIHALRRISSDLNQSELLSIAHESIYSVLYYAAGSWLNGGLHKKIVKRLKVLSNSTLQIVFGKKRQECSTLELHSLANMLIPEQMALHQPGFLL